MPLVRRIPLLVAALLATAVAPAGARAAGGGSQGFHLQSTALFVHEDSGSAVITIERGDTSQVAQIRYVTLGDTAQAGYDFVSERR